MSSQLYQMALLSDSIYVIQCKNIIITVMEEFGDIETGDNECISRYVYTMILYYSSVYI